ncbi:MAG: primosomal protein N' [Candidatus Methylacidiphilales bacterium]|nr:primosomal protein N' [Candidatus Methylacidiphilales bacterium]
MPAPRQTSLDLASAGSAVYVRVVPEIALDKAFDYVLPPSLKGKVLPGHRVRVPWGKKSVLAYVVDFPEVPEVARCREVEALVDAHPLIPPPILALARWMAAYYCCDLPQVLKMMLPGVVRQKEDAYKKQLRVTVPDHLVPGEVEAALGRATAQKKAWHAARAKGGGFLAELCRELKTTATTFHALADRGFVRIGLETIERDPATAQVTTSDALLLNPEQKHSLELILAEAALPQPKPVLIQGVTGSGKTEVYLQALSAVLDRGKSAIILVPEIALTPQTIERFRSRFEGREIRVAVLHSHLSAGERHDQWQNIRSGKARVVIGARSAIFAPVPNLGLIVVDEEHESGYKQEEAPHYQARDVAVMRGFLEKVPVVLGSATPSLESVHNARQGKYRLVRLNARAEDFRLPRVHIVDLRKEPQRPGHPALLSEVLKKALTSRLEKGEQAIIFLNRRGFASSLQCPKCGHVEECPHCAVPLTYHRSEQTLRCHFCDHRADVPRKCPECNFDQYRLAGTGTQRIEEAVARDFPAARWCRMDSDSMRNKGAFVKALDDFREKRTDILVGTQMIAKGLHFPNVTCVGVVSVDHALNLPDFRAGERVFQQLVQVAGRAGRGEVPGEVFVQTYSPHQDAIQFARHHDVDGFQESELQYRQAHGYPPFSRAVLITFRGRSEEKTKFCIETAARRLKEALEPKIQVPDPGPAPLPRLRDHFRYQIFLLVPSIAAVAPLLKREIVDVNWPGEVRAVVDVDPVNLL